MSVVVIPIVAENKCLSVKIQKPKSGHRCVTTSQRYKTIPNIHSHLCTHLCMQRGNCSVINYNHERRYCQLTSDDCQRIIEDSEFTVTFFSCLQWVRVEDIVDDMRIPCDTDSDYFVGRLVLHDDVLVGRYSRRSGYTRVWKSGDSFSSDDDAQVLQKMKWCSVNWVPYNASDSVPVGAVVGGYVGAPTFETYIITGASAGQGKVCGFYNPATELGYMALSSGPQFLTEMDILVLQKI